jgi:abhydrolase domain-containing protein 6
MVYSEQGPADADFHLLLLHGLFDQRATWSLITPHLTAAGFHIVAPDLIGFGDSSRPHLSSQPDAERYSMDMQVGLLRIFIERLGLDNLIVVGSSLGGGLALRLLCTPWPSAPQVRALVLEGAAGHAQGLPAHLQIMAGWPGRLIQHRWIQSMALRSGVLDILTRQTFRRAFHDPGKIRAEVLQSALDVLHIPGTLDAYRQSVRNLIPADIFDFPKRYQEIDIPTLILWGREDNIVPPLFGLLFEEQISNSTLHVFDECGHAPHLELPEETAVVIRDWIRRRLS